MPFHRHAPPLALSVACLLSAGALVVSVPQQAQAQTQVLDFTGGAAFFSGGNNTLGWEFNLSTTVSVTDLGVFDEGNNGFIDTHPVGLWTTGGTLLASTTLASGASGTPVVSASGFGAFRYNAVAPVVLTPGNYVLGAQYPTAAGGDAVRSEVSSVALASGFTFVQGRFISGTGFAFPTGTFATSGGHFGPNLRFSAVATSAAPEPASLALLALSGLPLVGAVIRRRRAA